MDYSKKSLRIFTGYIARHRKIFILDMICALLVSAVDLGFPYASRYLMNTLLPEKKFRTFFLVIAVIVGAYLLKSVFNYIMVVLGHRMGVRVEADMREDIFRHVQELSCSFFDKNRTGVLLSRITSELFEVTELAHHGPEDVLICTITIIGSMVVMYTIEWRLALVLTVILPLCLWFLLTQRQRMKTANMEVKRKTAVITTAIESSISGVRTSKAFANEDRENEKFDEANELFKSAKSEYYKAMGLFQSGMEFTTSIMSVAVIGVGGFLIMKGRMNYVDLITFSLYVSVFVTPVRKLVSFFELYMQGSAGFTRFLEIMRTEPEIKDKADAKVLEETEGHVCFNNVSFHYDNNIPVLRNINLEILPGECLAVVGPSGGGKTTLCQLLPRFYDVCEGSITVDGTDIRDITQQSLRRNIGIIQQDVFMFAGTIKDNIRYGRPDATDAEIIEAAIKAEIHSEIMQMPDGYDSYIGERGVMLSGGQKQRISIARVFLKNPKILILDEATSALDTVTEMKIQKSLDDLSEGRTVIIIAHRLSTVKNADRIAVVEGEKITEEGTHAELMAKNGIYAELCRAQQIETED